MARVPPCHLGDSESEAPPFQVGPPLTSHEIICNYIVWIDRDHTLLSRDGKRSFHEMLRTTPNGKGSPLPFGRLRMQGSPLAICPALTSHEMICNYIAWIDRDHTLLSRDEKKLFHEMLRTTPNGKGPPLTYFVQFLTSHEMICNYIVWIDRDHTLLSRVEKRSFHDMLRATPNATVPPCNLSRP